MYQELLSSPVAWNEEVQYQKFSIVSQMGASIYYISVPVVIYNGLAYSATVPMPEIGENPEDNTDEWQPISGEANVITPVIANHFAVFTNTTGSIGDDAATAINGGNIQAGLSGTAGTLASFPATASKGSLKLTAVDNTGNTITTISNAVMGQATTVSIPDPAAATANFVIAPVALVNNNLVKASGTAGLVADAGFSIKAQTTEIYAGGGTSNAFTATGLTASSIVTASILTSTNAVSITKVTPGTNTLTVEFSADPGTGTTVNYIATSAAV